MAGTDREAELTARLAALEGRLNEVESRAAQAEAAAAEAEARARDAEARSMGSPFEAVEAVLGAMLPTEVRGHLRAARKEQLLAVRAMVDAWIERVDRAPGERPAHRRRESIPLEDA
jgi:BMFP domain-containing protein YqiC